MYGQVFLKVIFAIELVRPLLIILLCVEHGPQSIKSGVKSEERAALWALNFIFTLSFN